jgi:hypothetical protein
MAEKRVIHQEVMRRGMDYLTEVELGKAPPVEYAVRNLKSVDLNAEGYISQPMRASERA